MNELFKGKKILVTGGTGSIGSVIVRRLLKFTPRVIRVFSNDEDGLFNLQQELLNYENLRFLVGDIKDGDRLRRAMENIDLVFHCAALKHVPSCEYNPFEAVKTNVIGTQNVIEAALDQEVEKVITISTDKAANPTNVMGVTKLLAERLTVSANYYKGSRKTVFACVRFGNVLDSRGSIVPLIRKQIEGGGPVTITEPDMTRFVMTIPGAVELVMEAAEKACGGEIFVLQMSALQIGDLVEALKEEVAPQYGYDPGQIETKIIGRRAGEKQHEELVTDSESTHTQELGNMFVITPEIKLPEIIGRDERADLSTGSMKKYTSKDQPMLTKEEIKQLLRKSWQQSG